MKQTTGFYPRLKVDTAKVAAVGQAGGVLLTATVRAAGLDVALSAGWRVGVSRWRCTTRARSSPTWRCRWRWVVTALPTLGCCEASPASSGGSPQIPTISRTITALAGDAGAALAAIDTARAAARARVWSLAGEHVPDACASAKAPLVIDLDATLVTAHSEKENARPTFKRGFGFHPLWAFADHGQQATGEPLAVLLRAGNAGSNTATDHITV